MSRSYDLDTNAAKKADEKASRIEATGDYIGTFKYAIAKKAKSGADGIELHFEDRAKQEARLTLWTHKGDGTALSGFNVLQAILTCLSLRGIKAAPQPVELYDAQAKTKVRKELDVYPDLMGKPIGLLLQLAPEEYLDKQGSLKVANKLEIYSIYNADSRMVASEILARAPKAEKLEKVKASLKDRALKKLPAGQSAQSSGNGGPAPTGGFDDFDDCDIPF
ncbi:hypothetical protein [Chitinimonas sp.]|uniref:hypothetical protein n=1 Tax=Chitinimonas sp. TaxID=1934313 RepID=UPI0035AFD1B5